MMHESQIDYLDSGNREVIKLLPPLPVVLSSAESGWKALALEQLRLPALEMPENIAGEHLITIKLSAPSTLEWKARGNFESRRFLPGDTCLTPAETPREMRWYDSVEVLVLALDPASLSRTAQETSYADRIELVVTHGEADAQLYYTGLALKAELESGNLGGRLYADAMANTLAIHLLARYNARMFGVPQFTGGLSPSQLRCAVEYIQDHLDQELSLTAMAEVLQMSTTRFKLLFKQSTGLAPHQYVIEQRVERAKQLLTRSDLTFSQIAVQVGFYDQSHLNRHFKRLLGITPRAFRRFQ